ncbi:putative HD phosphohydrolase [Tupanvirus deep ocean]|uniref:HD phosphohydrolase n=2 Tax=Tupanvirus TaxID=2094720 RepID=A0AC62A8J2_9VIRU|nr:putative HD phosphohydrolase [Tupanvirus deep ocean]QKU34087.1 putative HD phosphohydrolase [Tupanvirus deep ocean]
MTNTNNVIDEIMSLYEKYGSKKYIGENISQVEHMVQAAMLAEESGEDIDIILAAFLHDIGHLLEINNELKQMNSFGVINHENIAKEYLLGKGFSNKISNLVGNHVNAKRYLVSVCPDYYENLSSASKQTLEYQNGKMKKNEINNFKSDPFFKESLRVRSYDDQAKIVGFKIKPLDYYRDMLVYYFGTI